MKLQNKSKMEANILEGKAHKFKSGNKNEILSLFIKNRKNTRKLRDIGITCSENSQYDLLGQALSYYHKDSIRRFFEKEGWMILKDAITLEDDPSHLQFIIDNLPTEDIIPLLRYKDYYGVVVLLVMENDSNKKKKESVIDLKGCFEKLDLLLKIEKKGILKTIRKFLDFKVFAKGVKPLMREYLEQRINLLKRVK